MSPGTTSSAVSSTSAPVADRLRPRRDQQRELVEGLLRLQLLADADRGVDDRDQAEDRVGPEAEREDEDEEAADDRVEQRQDVGGDDARHRAAVRRLGLAEAGEPRCASTLDSPWSPLQSLRTFAAAMLATERLPSPPMGPRRASRRAASALDSSLAQRACFHPPIYTEAVTRRRSGRASASSARTSLGSPSGPMILVQEQLEPGAERAPRCGAAAGRTWRSCSRRRRTVDVRSTVASPGRSAGSTCALDHVRGELVD